MKRLVSGGLAATIMAVLLACGGDGNGGPAGPNNPNLPNNGTLSARIDGVEFTAIGIQVAASQNPPIIAIGAADAAGRGLGFAFSTSNGTGTQSIGITSLANCSLTEGGQGWLATQSMGSGTITITTLTANRAAGTFTFTVLGTTATATPPTRQITQGTFDVTF